MKVTTRPDGAARERAADEVTATQTGGLLLIVCALLVALCFAAPLLLTLPGTWDLAAASTGASPGPAPAAAAAASNPGAVTAAAGD